MALSLKRRLRLGLVFCLTCTMFATLTQWRQLKTLEQHTASLHLQTAPQLARVAAFSKFAALLPETIAQIDTAQSISQLENAAARAANLLEESVSELGWARPDTREISKDFQSALEDLSYVRAAEIHTTKQFRIKALKALEYLDIMSKRIDDARGRTHHILPPTRSPDTVSAKDPSILEDVLVLADLDAKILHLVLYASELLEAPGRASSDSSAKLKTHFADLAETIAQIPDADIKTSLQVYLTEVEDIFFGRQGLFELVHFQTELSEDRAKASGAILPLGVSFSTEVDRASAAISKDFQTAALTTRLTTRHVMSAALTSNIVLVGMSFFLLFLVFERLVISRITALSEHVLNMTAGNLGIPIPSRGTDEVSILETAVEESRQTSLALLQSNEDLERFAYIAAHDLRTPLRAVSNLVDWTLEDHGDTLPIDARKNLRLIDGRVQRLSNHLSALLEYARAGQNSDNFTFYDLKSNVQSILADHASDHDFSIHVTGGPQCFETYVAPLNTILVNLISNAVKHNDTGSGQIDIIIRQIGTQLEIRVQDDGPGVPVEYQTKVFELFQTIQTRDHVEGSGLGLALVQKLVQSLGGTVSLTSDPTVARGSTFTIHLPETSWRYASPTEFHEAAE